ncbi:histidine kinase OS=Streptomyces fumanus OX=67302 GN=GCM10018772_25090 PE=4 SV=1 [Streptomyces fumanus]
MTALRRGAAKPTELQQKRWPARLWAMWRGARLSIRLTLLLLTVVSTTLSVTAELITNTMQREANKPIDSELVTTLDTLQLLRLRQPAAFKGVTDADGSLVGERGSQLFFGTPPSATGVLDLPDRLPPDDEPVSVGGEDDGEDASRFAHYRLLVRTIGPGTTVVVARDLHENDASSRRVRAIVLIVRMSSLVVIALLSALIVYRELRPLERVAITADRIAAGDFDLRLRTRSPSHTAPSSEVGRLSTALDRMLDEIQASFEARDRSEERLRQFVADASHELRTPLQSIRGYGELYQKGVLTNTPDVDQAIDRMLSEVARMTKLVDELLALARLDELQEADLDPVDFSRVVSDSCRDASAVEPHRPRRDLVTSGITVSGDEAQLRRLVAEPSGERARPHSAGRSLPGRAHSGWRPGRPARPRQRTRHPGRRAPPCLRPVLQGGRQSHALDRWQRPGLGPVRRYRSRP